MVQKCYLGVLGVNITRFWGNAHWARTSRFAATFESVGGVGKSFSRIPLSFFQKMISRSVGIPVCVPRREPQNSFKRTHWLVTNDNFSEKRLFRLRIKKSLFDKNCCFSEKKFRLLENDFFRTKLRKSLSGKRRFFPEKRLFSGMQ